ncbi:flagellar assembly protein FliW [Serpentinicella alkaliphila]|uniref:Flagellar assembly factor FliW n=1 Tax=Serpentinicella alkaliphila TaxID=1734049 RepID=A0A4R2TJY2_9FIRM|nr:flagellar assembly protein FliW [Serpentinicella alkaliphila]QUH24925.1 flagellar assembly protein FliW [Serpentinicella alkaliphila]TCQ02727.1 flagellar assembly factor FliW [Serpentinicella alkaliphila]
MLINSKHFGEIEIEKEKILKFVDGIPGLNNLTEYVILDNEDADIPFKWLQSVEDEDVTFVILNPFIFKPDYDFVINDSTITRLEIENEKDIIVYSIVVVPEDITKMTANLAAPIIINSMNKKAKQVILEGDKYSIKHYIMDELNNNSTKNSGNDIYEEKVEEAL